MNLRLTSSLFLCTALLCACDEGADPGPSTEFRDTTPCLPSLTIPPTTIKKVGVPNDYEVGEVPLELAVEQADEAVIAYARMNPENEKVCSSVCEREELRWTGENCVANSDYTVGEYKEYENEDGKHRYSVPVETGETEVGCACE